MIRQTVWHISSKKTEFLHLHETIRKWNMDAPLYTGDPRTVEIVEDERWTKSRKNDAIWLIRNYCFTKIMHLFTSCALVALRIGTASTVFARFIPMWLPFIPNLKEMARRKEVFGKCWNLAAVNSCLRASSSIFIRMVSSSLKIVGRTEITLKNKLLSSQ